VTSESPEFISESLSNCVLRDANASNYRIGDLIKDQPAFLLFIRHFGCIGCSENIATMSPRFPELARLGVRTLVIGCGASLFIEGFIERHNLIDSHAEFYSDDTLSSHKAAGLMYGLWGGFRPRALFEMGRAYVNGHVSREHQGDIKQHAGAVFLDHKGQIKLYHRNQSLGDHVDPAKVIDVALVEYARINREMM